MSHAVRWETCCRRWPRPSHPPWGPAGGQRWRGTPRRRYTGTPALPGVVPAASRPAVRGSVREGVVFSPGLPARTALPYLIPAPSPPNWVLRTAIGPAKLAGVLRMANWLYTPRQTGGGNEPYAVAVRST